MLNLYEEMMLGALIHLVMPRSLSIGKVDPLRIRPEKTRPIESSAVVLKRLKTPFG